MNRMTPTTQKAERIVAVGGGKGGVGKTVISVNLAVALAKTGRRVVAVDLDLGAANLHTLFGINRTEPGLASFLARDIETLDEAAQPTKLAGLSVIAGASKLGTANINHGQKLRLLRAIQRIDADVVLLDVGAGAAYNTLDFFNAAQGHVLVLAPQMTSLQNGYAFLKSAIFRAAISAGEDAETRSELAQIAKSLGETASVRTLLSALEHEPKLQLTVSKALSSYNCCIAGNQIHADREVASIDAISRMFRDFLGLDVPVVASIPHSSVLRESVNERQPLLLSKMSGSVAASFHRLANTILARRAVPTSTSAIAHTH